MPRFRSLISRLSALLRRRELDDRAHEEIEFHLGMEIEENMRQGMAPADARAAARRKVGNTTQVREQVHRMNTISFLEEIAQDVRFSLRAMRRNPGFALTAVLVLALGLGASTAMFSALDRMLFHPLPYADSDRLVNFGMIDPGVEHGRVFLPDREYPERWKPAPEPFTAVTIASAGMSTCDITERQPEHLPCTSVESNFLQTFGVRPVLGRDFTPEDDVRGVPPVALISHEVWKRRFGADPSIVAASPGTIGRTIDLNGSPVPVVGVLPAGFVMPSGEVPGILQPLQIYPPLPDPPGGRLGGSVAAFGRLKPGVTQGQAEAAIAPLIADSAKGLRRAGEADFQPRVVLLRDYWVGDSARVAWLLLSAVGGLLLIACVNVANLILARLAVRDREFAVRWALGAGSARLSRLALIESLLLALAGGGLGLLLADALLRVFVELAPPSIPEIGLASVDLRVFAVAALLAVAAGAAVGIWPVLAILRSRALQYGPRATAGPRSRMRFTLVTAQIALTMTMLAVSALLLRTLWNLISVPLGYESKGVVTMNVNLEGQRHPYGSNLPIFERLLERVREIPGTTAAAMTSHSAPTGVFEQVRGVAVDHERDTRANGLLMRVRAVTPGYFRTFGIPILRGRAFVDAERGARPPLVILSESAARFLFPGQDPIGHTLRLGRTGDWSEVVGVAGDIRNNGPIRELQPEIYLGSWRAADAPRAFFAIRTQASTADAVVFMKQAVADIDPRLPVTIEPLSEEVARLTERPRFLAWLLSAFAGLALLLAAAGLYGVASYLVAQRTRDIGVRMALGASPADISRQVVGEAGRWIAAGAVLGCSLAWAATRAIEAELYMVSSRDPVSWIAALGVLGVALLFAVALPAARAARVDPIEALRAE